jgi:hypothetical protein
MEDDMENYIRYKLMGGNKILKRCVVPHIFQCQADRKRAAEEFIRNVASKRVRRRLLEEAVSVSVILLLPLIHEALLFFQEFANLEL